MTSTDSETLADDLPEMPDVTGSRPRRVGRAWTMVLVIAALLAGLLGRSLITEGSDSFLVSWLPWMGRTSVTLFFSDGEYLVPVSRTVPRDEATPQALVGALLAGPAEGTGLVSLVPEGTVARSVSTDGSSLSVDLSGTYATNASPLSHEALYQSMRSWPGVDQVSVTVDGVPLETNTSGHLLYFYDETHDMLVAQTTNRVRVGDLLAVYLEGPDDPRLTGLPADIESLSIDLASNDLLTLGFTFRESLRSFAVDHPESVRRVLEGLIATFSTGFPDVGGILLDFEGHNTLGLGQCANLLNTAQLMPEVLNDERLLSRHAEA
jgi:hypothetical protein